MSWERGVRRLSWACLILIAAYSACGAFIVVFFGPYLEHTWVMWPEFLPEWPLWALGILFVLLNVVDVVVIAVRGRVRARRRRRALVETTAWLNGPDAGMARQSGDPEASPSHVRAHAHHERVELLWDAPAVEVEFIVLRSTSGYATDPDDQTLVFRGRDLRFSDWEVAEGRVYFYTLFAASRRGGWSPPSWVHAVIPVVPLRHRLSGQFAEAGSKITLGGGDLQKYGRHSRR